MAEELYDLVIIGGGPAGMSAGIYGGRAKLKTLIIEKGSLGGRAFTTREIVNYPGYNMHCLLHTNFKNISKIIGGIFLIVLGNQN